MQPKMNVYAEVIAPLVERIARLCQDHDLPMMMAFCLDKEDIGGGRMQMTIAGSSNLGYEIEPPEPMLFAADLLRIPGFKPGYQSEMEEE